MDKVLVIVVTYNAHDWIRQCLNSVDMERYDAFVVDNASTDDTLSILHTEYPKALVRAMDKNLGFGQANNIGLRYALDNGYDYVFLLNQDAWLLPDTIEKLIAAQKQHPEYLVLSPLQMNTEQGRVESQFKVYLERFQVDTSANSIQNVMFCNAATWLIAREGIMRVGGFDPIFPHYGEDTDYLQRVIFHGGKIGIFPSAQAYHERGSVSNKSDEKAIYITMLVYMGMLKNINQHLFICNCNLFIYIIIHLLKNVCKLQFCKIRISYLALKGVYKKYKEIKEHRIVTKTQAAYI